MEPFELSGLWWTPENPDGRVAGVLRFSLEDGLVLSLFGTLGEYEWGAGGKLHPSIHGSVYDSPHGENVTLTRCSVNRFSITIGKLKSESYRVSRAFLGEHLSRPEDFLFSRCDLGMSGLSDWAVSVSGLRTDLGDPDKGETFDFRAFYVRPEPRKVVLSDATLELFIGAGHTRSLREFSVKEEVLFRLSSKPTSEERWNDQFVYPLLNFVTLVTDSPSALTRYELSAEDGSRRVRVVGKRVFMGPVVEKNPGQVLFSLHDVEETFSDRIKGWMSTTETYRNTCNIFFASRYAPDAFLDVRFLVTCQALEVYQTTHARIEGSPPPTPDLPLSVLESLNEEQRDELIRWASGPSFDTFPQILRQLSSEHRSILDPLAATNADELINEIIAIRNSVLHRTGIVYDNHYSLRLLVATLTLSFLMKSCFLKEIGFDSSERAAIFLKNAMFEFIRDKWESLKGASTETSEE